jgi:hypothetical protein
VHATGHEATIAFLEHGVVAGRTGIWRRAWWQWRRRVWDAKVTGGVRAAQRGAVARGGYATVMAELHASCAAITAVAPSHVVHAALANCLAIAFCRAIFPPCVCEILV